MRDKHWGVFEQGNGDVHSVPLKDKKRHLMESNCPCKPTVEIYGANILYIHHAWDNREVTEQLEEERKNEQK